MGLIKFIRGRRDRALVKALAQEEAQWEAYKKEMEADALEYMHQSWLSAQYDEVEAEQRRLGICQCSRYHKEVLTCDDCGEIVEPYERTDMHDFGGVWVLTLCHKCHTPTPVVHDEDEGPF